MRLRFRILAALMTVGVLAGCNAGSPPPPDAAASYPEQLQAARAALDEAFRSRPNQPVPPHLMDKLLPLKYFRPTSSTSYRRR